MEERKTNEQVLSRVAAERRGFVKRLLAGAAFAAPVLATFTMDALAPSSAQAQALNSSAPEPGTLGLIGAGVVGLGIAAWRGSKNKKTGTDESKPAE